MFNTTFALPYGIGDELWYASEELKEVWPVTITAIKAEWSEANPVYANVTVTLARKAPSQLTIQVDGRDIGTRDVFLTERNAYVALKQH